MSNTASVLPAHLERHDAAITIAQQAAELLRTMRPSANDHVELKKHIHDIVSQADKDTESLVIALIEKMFPDDGIVGEEGTNKVSRSGYSWVIDPLDGTRNFLHQGYGKFAVSIGIEYDGKPVAGVVLDVMTGTIYHAALNHGAYRNDERIYVSDRYSLDEATIGYDGAMDNYTKRFQGAVLRRLISHVGDIRRMGCSSLDYCYVADGTTDGTYNHGTGPWDISAGLIIASEAGARVGSTRRGSLKNVPLAADNMAATPGIFDALQKRISSPFPYRAR